MAQFEFDGSILVKCRLDRGEKEVVIPEGVTKLAKRLFKGRKSIVKVTLPEGILEIGEQAFFECPALESCNLPDSLTLIGQNAFEGCTALTDITLPSGNVNVLTKAFSGCTGITSVEIPQGWNCVPHSMFQGCTNLRHVTIPEGVMEIQGNAFNGCVNLEDVRLPESLIKICGGAFSGSGIRNIRIPANVIEAWGEPFSKCSQLKKIEYAVFPKIGTKLMDDLKKMLLKEYQLSDAVDAADNVPDEFRKYTDWIRKGAVFPREEDLHWPEEIISKLKYDDYVLIMNTCSCINMSLYHVIGNEYTDSKDESYNYCSKAPHYLKLEDHFKWMMTDDRALRAYRYENGKLAETKELSQQLYNSWVYEGCVDEVILRNEFGLEPQDQQWKEKFAEALEKAEKFRKTLVYACYMNDTPAIIERAKTANKTELNRKFEYFGTPLSFCAKNDNLEGFKSLCEAGADINKKITAGTVSPLGEAVSNSPRILRYILEEYPTVFENNFGNWNGGIFWCDDRELIDYMAQIYGTDDLKSFYFSLLIESSVDLERLKYLADHNVDCNHYVHSYYKHTALEFAQLKYEQYPNEDHRIALEILTELAMRQG